MSESRTTYHLTPLEVWERQSHAAEYFPEFYERDGFVHCTDGEAAVLESGNRHCVNDPRPYCLLTIALDRLACPVKYEDPGHIYPHIYGQVNDDAVLAVHAIERSPDGRFVRVGSPT